MALTYELIKSANERVETIELKGKKYAAVSARVQAFRELCPNGCISTDYDFKTDDKGIFIVCKTSVYDDNGKLLATGMAYEREGSTQVNRTSYIENCETSAVGRALGMIGLGSQTSMASAEEMANALFQQNSELRKNDDREAKDLVDIVLGLGRMAAGGDGSDEAIKAADERTMAFAKAVAEKNGYSNTDLMKMTRDEVIGVKVALAKKAAQ